MNFNSKLKNKNSISSFTFMVLVSIIILLLVLVIILFFYYEFKENSDRLVQKEMCKKSVQAASFFKIRVSGVQLIDDLGRAAPLKCYTQYETVPAGKELQGISNAMYDCWDQFNQGRSETFDTKNNNYCVICSRLEFEKKARFTGLTEYLMNTNIPGSSEKYFEFLSGYKVDGKVREEYANSNLINIESIDTSVPQAVVFVMEKKVASQGLAGSAIGTGVGIAVVGALSIATVVSGGAAAPLWVFGSAAFGGGAGGYFFGSHSGATNYNTLVLVAPYNELSSLKCNILEGHAKPLEVAASVLDSK